MGLVLLRKLFFNQKDRFPEDNPQKCTTYKFDACALAKIWRLFLRLLVPNFFLASFLSFPFSRPSLVSLPFAFHIVSGCRKTWKMGPGSIVGIIRHFTSIFAPELITFFNLLSQNAVDIQNRLFLG